VTDGWIMDEVTEWFAQMDAVIAAAWEAWSPCGPDPRWCWEHSEKPIDSMHDLGQALRALDPAKADTYGIPSPLLP
jgi:hypothetical protein